VVVSSAGLVTGCSAADDVMATVGLAAPDTAQAPEQPDGDSQAMVVTSQQRAFLDELKAAGVTPSSDLMALRIGSYVCQAHAAKQNDQAVWDVVMPLVRGDVRTAHMSAVAPPANDVNSATADYIRIATDKLC
jgi:hypothetical protein